VNYEKKKLVQGTRISKLILLSDELIKEMVEIAVPHEGLLVERETLSFTCWKEGLVAS